MSAIRILMQGLLAGLLLLPALGCTPRDVEANEEASSLKPLAVLYGQYLGQHRGQPPANESAFKQFVGKQGPAMLKSFGIEDQQALWTSSRDGQPYVVIYGPVQGPPGPGGAPVIAYEQQGVNGKRMVASSLGAVDELDDAAFRQLVPGAK